MGIWNINPEFLLGIYLGKLPVEEMLFFVITNLMVLQVSCQLVFMRMVFFVISNFLALQAGVRMCACICVRVYMCVCR
jgi:hypothetical protein